MTLRYPRPPALGRLGPRLNVVEASAGTGKTFLLEHLFVDLVLGHGIAADQILVVTFTEKAAAELVLRVRKLVAELADLSPDHPKAVAATGAPDEACWLLDEPARRRLHEARLAFGRSSIFTIHAFCQRVLREHAFAQGRLFDEELVDEKTVFAEVFHEVLRTKAASQPALRGLVSAWLGAGNSIASLAKLLWECQEKDAEALRPAFDPERLAAAIAAWRPVDGASLVPSLKAAGLHPNTVRAMPGHIDNLGALVAGCGGDPARFLAAAGADAKGSLSYLADKLVEKKPSPAVAALAQAVRELDAATVPLPAVMAQSLLPVVQARAAARKRGSGHYDYGDMLRLVAAALADPGPAGRGLLATLRARYRHGLIDEFQDTDRVQWPIFRRIFVEAPDHAHGLTVVGDPKQAIYGFRSADVHTYLAATSALVAAGARSLILPENYRSSEPLIAATHLIFAQPGFFGPGSGIAYAQPVTCGRPQRALLSATWEPAPPVTLLRLPAAAGELGADEIRDVLASAMAGEIRRISDGASRLRVRDGNDTRSLEPGDIFVLTFTNNESRAMGEALGRAGIRHSFYKLDKLFESPEAAEIRDLLAALCAPEDRNLRGKALLTRFFDLDLPAVAALADATTESPPLRLLLRLAAAARAPDIPALFAALLEQTGVMRRELWRGGSERGLTNIMHVLELLQAEWARTHASLPELVQRLDAFIAGTAAPPGHETDLQRLETDESCVQILTIHKAKGLEADVVFVFGGLCASRKAQAHLFHEAVPGSDARGQRRALFVGKPAGEIARSVADEAQDEQSRLHYVALTRARYRLYLPYFPPPFPKLDGAYRPVNDHLTRLLDGLPAEERALFGSEPVAYPVMDVGQALAGAHAPARLPEELLATPAVPADVAAIRHERAGFLVTSYSTVKRLQSGLAAADDSPAHADEPQAPREPAPDRLPGGAETGIFLHEILAAVPLAGLAGRPAFAAWYESPGIAPLLSRLRRRHARPASQIEPAARLVHAAYTTPVRLGDGQVMAGLASATCALREMEFLFPMPEPSHPLLGWASGAAFDPAWTIERGVVRGFVDYLFEHAGRVYVCDWKSDDLPGFDRATLAEHCEAHYDVQARIYTLAALRLFKIESAADYARGFGGVLFCFLRGRPGADESQGVFSFTPSWDDVLAWQSDMLGQAFWGLDR
ncbi:MAG: UvrD-helicase domain-containing protein [Deltaproteobacteria bacterium]|nr:UvrD-helicase domain-containing protein [Deltaproteobacteria bacterium]